MSRSYKGKYPIKYGGWKDKRRFLERTIAKQQLLIDHDEYFKRQ